MTQFGNDPWDPLMDVGDLSGHWTITNLGEAAPGVITPLASALWNRPTDQVARRSAYAIGAMTRAERDSDSEEIRVVRLYYGHVAARLEYMARFGDRMPGTSGEEAIVSLFDKVPPGMTFSPTRRRYPIIAVRLPTAFALSPRRIRALAAEQDRWWRAGVDGAGSLDHAAATRQFAAAVKRFEDSMTTHVIGLLSSVQPLFDTLSRLVDRVGIGDVALLSGSGGAEMAVVGDIWKASRGRIDIDEVARIHGFHGPAEGELSSRVWREDPTPLRTVVEQYAQRPESDDPLERERRREAESEKARREILAALPRGRRAGAALLLRLARERIPMRGVGKRSFLQAIDVARASARRAGELLAADGVLDDPDDVFYLTGAELVGGLPADARELVALRRERRAAYQGLSFVAAEWSGMPDVVDAGDLSGPEEDVVTGTGVSAGVVEGSVRLVTNPDFADVEPDEVLVAPFTDPSWSSIMFVSSALVVDIGGALSHAAVVARELGIPCVVNTRTGTKALRTGDRVRVDGEAGTVEILERAAV